MEAKAAPEEHKDLIDRMFKVGAHYAYSRTRRHPSAKPFIFGVKNQVELFDLEKVRELLHHAMAFMEDLGRERKTVLFVGGKNEARELVKAAAETLHMPYVASRWIGGTLTNFSEVKKRTARLHDLMEKRDTGEFEGKYTKRERLMFDREIADLEDTFGGVAAMTALPAALYVVDSRREHIAVAEAQKVGIPVVALVNSDCDLAELAYPIVGNDSARGSIALFTSALVEAYRKGLSVERAPEVSAAA